MITTDALKYLPQMGLDPSCVVGCAGTKCQNSFALAIFPAGPTFSQNLNI
jgi:hypothetical protein